MASLLIVGRHPGNLRLVETLLAPEGHHVRTAVDGAEALRLVRSAPPDLVRSDVMMPLLNGFEVCRSIKQNPTTRLIPVVLITSLGDNASRLRGVEAGADDFISKPFNATELKARVRSLLRIKGYTDDLDNAQSVIMSLALTIEARDAGDRWPLPAAGAVRLGDGSNSRARRAATSPRSSAAAICTNRQSRRSR